MSMTMYGANPEQLTNLGSTLNRQIDAITQVMSTVQLQSQYSNPSSDTVIVIVWSPTCSQVYVVSGSVGSAKMRPGTWLITKNVVPMTSGWPA